MALQAQNTALPRHCCLCFQSTVVDLCQGDWLGPFCVSPELPYVPGTEVCQPQQHPCHAAACPSAAYLNPPHHALLCLHRSEPTERLSTHISLSAFQCYPKQWEAGIVNKEVSTSSLANPNYWAFELSDINAFRGHLVLFHHLDRMVLLYQRVPKTTGFF